MECPSCEGKKQTFAFVNDGALGHYAGPVDCFTCKGTGVITDEKMSRMIAGKVARAARIGRGETLRQDAQRKGVTALEISKFERGEV